MIRTALRLTPIMIASTIFSTSAIAADLIIKDETSPVPDSFDSSRFYISAFAGASFLDDINLTGLIGGNPNSVELEQDTGYTFGGAIGHNYGDIGNGLSLRAEIELSYSENNVDQIFFSGNGPGAEINVDGDFSTTNLVVNGLVDLNEFGSNLFTPYIGAGVGVAFSDIEAVYGPGVRLDTSDENLIAQAIVGASFVATENTNFFVEGRYSRIFNFETPRLAPTGALTGVIEDDIDTYGINLGFRIKL